MNTPRLPEKTLLYPSHPSAAFVLMLAAGLLLCLLLADCAQAAEPPHPRGVLDGVYGTFRDTSETWADTMTQAASWLFWTLAAISLSFTFGMMALRQADMGEFFTEFVRFCLFTGFFWWLLSNAPAIASSIIESLSTLATKASGTTTNDITPSSIIDMGWDVFFGVAEQKFEWHQIASKLISVLMAGGFLVLCCIIAVDYLILMISCWLLLYAGIFVLGFGGSRWTSEMALGYYKTVLGTAAQLMAMILVIGLGKNLIEGFTSTLGTDGTHGLHELGVLIVAGIVVMMMVKKLPPLVGGMLTGGAVGGGDMAGRAGASTMKAAAGMAMGMMGVGALAGAALNKAKEAGGGGGGEQAAGGGGGGGSGNESGGSSDTGADTSSALASNDSQSGNAGGDNTARSRLGRW